jgi:hypothetical protein
MMKSLAVVALIGGIVLPAIGCAGTEQQKPASSAVQTKQNPERVRLAADIAREIKNTPGEGAAILEKHGMTREDFEQLLYEIAADPELSQAFREAVQ